MSRRTVVLLIIAAGIWSVALIYLFLPPKGGEKGKVVVVKTPKKVSTEITDITPELIRGYVEMCNKGVKIQDPFTPYVLKEGEEGLKTFVLNSDSVVDYIKFGGYIIGGDGEGKLFLEIAGDKVIQSPDDLIDDRYMVVYISSVGLVVLDVIKGGLYVIR